MSYDLSVNRICEVVQSAIEVANGGRAMSEPITAGSRMNTPREWDSLSFVAVFTAVGQAFDVELEDDDAIHFQSIAGIEGFLREILEE